GLERYQGHFYNWYDTLSLLPLSPLYVSSVDSGNLAGLLMTLRRGLCVLPDEPILHPRLFEGLSDTLRVLESVVHGAPAALLQQLERELDSAYDARPTATGAMRRWLDRLAPTINEIAAQSNIDPGEPPDKAIPESETAWWTRVLVRQFKAIVDECDLL